MKTWLCIILVVLGLGSIEINIVNIETPNLSRIHTSVSKPTTQVENTVNIEINKYLLPSAHFSEKNLRFIQSFEVEKELKRRRLPIITNSMTALPAEEPSSTGQRIVVTALLIKLVLRSVPPKIINKIPIKRS